MDAGRNVGRVAFRSGFSPGRCIRIVAFVLVAFTASALSPRGAPIPFGPDSAGASVYRLGSLPSPRSRTSAVWANGSAYIFGGRVVAPNGGLQQTGYEGSRQIVKFTPGGDGRVVAMLPPTPGFASSGRKDTSAIWDGRYAYVFGGSDDCGVPLDEIIRFDPATNEVRVLDTRLPLPTVGASAIWDGESAYIFGGYVQRGTLGCQGDRPVISDQIVRFTPGTGATTLSEKLPSPRNHAAAVFADPNVYIYGGHNGRDALDDIVEFVPIPGVRSDVRVVGRLPSPRHDTSAMWLPGNPFPTGNAYIFGGAASSQDDSATNQIVAHDPLDDPIEGQPVEVVDQLVGGSAHTSAVASDAAGGYILGGESGPAAGGGARDLSDQISRFTRPTRYVALGDSYSSGEGLADVSENGPYLAGGDPDCHRHPLAYPRLFQFNGPPELDFYACSGARTEHIYLKPQRPGEPNAKPQAFQPELTDRTDLVSFTIGGNDTGKPDDEGSGGLNEPLKFCLLHSECQKNAKFVAKLRSNIDKVAAKLRRTITSIKQRTGPDTAIFQLGYPRVFPSDPDPAQRKREQNCKSLNRQVSIGIGPIRRSKRVGWTAGEQTFLNGAIDRLNDQSLRVAEAAGIRFVDVTERFRGHAICDEGEGGNWINPLGIKLRPPSLKTSSFHPNLEGQIAYRDALRDSIDGTTYLIQVGAIAGRLTPIGLPANPAPFNRPLVRLNRVKTVRLGEKTSFSGKIVDDFGIDEATLRFGDGSSREVSIRSGGAFGLTHRYRKAKRYTARLTVVGNEGARATVKRKLRVEPKRKRRRRGR